MSQSDIDKNENLPEPIAPMPDNLNGEPVSPQPRDPKEIESSTENSQDSESSDVISEDQGWETVHLPNSVNVDRLEVAEDVKNPDLDQLEVPEEPTTPAESEGSDPLPLDYEMETIAQRIAAQDLVDKSEEQSSLVETELSQRIEYLETVLARYQRSLNEQQLSAEAQQAQIDEKIRQLQVAQEQINDLTQELEICQQELQHQQMAIAALSENWQQSQERLAQLERECAITQQHYNQQVHLNLQAANTCRELRTRLHRQQRQALQFKAALEKSLTHQESLINTELEPVITTGQSTPLNLQGDFSSDPSLDATEDPLAVSPGRVVPNSVPIQPWSRLSENPLSDFPEKPEATPIKPEAIDSKSLSPNLGESIDPLKLDGSGNLPTANAEAETFWPEENHLIQTIRDMVSTEGVQGLSDAVPENTEASDSLKNTEVNSTDSSDRLIPTVNDNSTVLPPSDRTESEAKDGSDLPFNRDLLEIPEFPDPMKIQEADPENCWPAPVVYPERSIKKRRSLASVELPSFPTKQ